MVTKIFKCKPFLIYSVHVFLHLKLILASNLSELEQFENLAANYQLASKKSENETLKNNAITKLQKRWLCIVGYCPVSKISCI